MIEERSSATPGVLTAWRSGSFVLCCTQEGGTMRGDIVLAAEFATTQAINTMLAVGRGVLCLALDGPLFDRLELIATDHDARWSNPRAPVATATIKAASDVTTGMSARDRAHTIAAAIRPDAGPNTVRQPGHVPVVRAASGGLVERRTPVEAAIELGRRTGTIPAAVLSEVLDETGELGDAPYLANLATLLRLPLIHVDDLASPLVFAAASDPRTS